MRPRMQPRWRTRFGSWVSAYTVTRLASELSITKPSVYDWLSARCVPDPSHALKITQISAGAVSLEDVYAHRAQVAPTTTSVSS
jgi:DNA-binding transcriptional regulator YdaS (Cro superfamily)